jgi:putative acetyltransferase
MKRFSIRPVTPEDVDALLAHLINVAAEPDIYVDYTPEEANVSPDKEREKIKKDMEVGNLRLMAEEEGKMIAYFACTSDPYYSITRHMAVLGMSVDRGHRNMGVGSALMARGIQWAQEKGIVRLELNVYADNAPAIHLYQKYGFEIEGRRRMYAYQRGRYYDMLIMSRLFL